MSDIKIINETREFVKDKFRSNPHYSFDDWHVMYNHSVMVEKIAMKISKNIKCDKTVVSIGSLLHDIGKTYKADKETLHKSHEDFNLIVSNEFLDNLIIDRKCLQKLKKIISYKSNSTEMKIIKDADALAFYCDEKLNTLFLNWAKSNNLEESIERKVKKFEKLRFESSRKIGIKWYTKMKKNWKMTI